MSQKNRQLFSIIIGSIIMGGTIYVSFKYLMKAPAPIKVGVLLLNVIVCYFTINFIKKQTNKNKNKHGIDE